MSGDGKDPDMKLNGALVEVHGSRFLVRGATDVDMAKAELKKLYRSGAKDVESILYIVRKSGTDDSFVFIDPKGDTYKVSSSKLPRPVDFKDGKH